MSVGQRIAKEIAELIADGMLFTDAVDYVTTKHELDEQELVDVVRCWERDDY